MQTGTSAPAIRPTGKAAELLGQAIRMCTNACGIRPWIFLQGIPSQGPLMLVSKDWRMRSGLRLPWQQYTADRKLQLVGFGCSEYFPKPVIPPRESCTAKALLGLLSFSNTACTSFMTLHLPKMKSKNFHSSSVGQRKLWGQEKFFSINLLSFHGFIAPLLYTLLVQKFMCVYKYTCWETGLQGKTLQNWLLPTSYQEGKNGFGWSVFLFLKLWRGWRRQRKQHRWCFHHWRQMCFLTSVNVCGSHRHDVSHWIGHPFTKGLALKNAYWATKGNSLMCLYHMMLQVKKEIKA